MKDLKHLIFFENLLENADNELVKQAQAEGDLAVGYTCYHVPECLLNVDKCFSVRLRAPYRSERDAIHLLHLVGNAYEPPLLFARKKLRREIVG